MIIGYTTGVYDLFHIGHLNLFKNAKGMCDKLIVGVTVDELVHQIIQVAFPTGSAGIDTFFEEINILSCPYRKVEQTIRRSNIKKRCLIVVVFSIFKEIIYVILPIFFC